MKKIQINQKTDIHGSIDQQVDFGDDGNLPVKGGIATVEPTNAVNAKFLRAFKSRDWHPADHGSFASQHGVEPFSKIKLNGLDQVAWTDHCVQNTPDDRYKPSSARLATGMHSETMCSTPASGSIRKLMPADEIE